MNQSVCDLQKSTSISSYLKWGIRFVFYLCIVPKSRREDVARREFILNIILVTTILLLGVFTILVILSTFYYPDYKGISIILVSSILIFCIFLLILSRQGYVRTASLLLLFLYFVPATQALLHWGIYLYSALLGYVIIIVISGIVLNIRLTLIVTSIISVTLLIIGFLHYYNFVAQDTSWYTQKADVGDAISLVVMFFLILVMTWLSNHEMEKALKRARRSEMLYRKERDSLEVRIEERTKELKKAQEDRVKQLSHLAEFGRMTSGFFHDLVNPLTAVSLNIEQLKQNESRDFSEIQINVDQAIKALDQLKHFVFTVNRHVKHKSTESEFSLNEEIQQAIEILGYKARKAQVDVLFLSTEEIKIWGDSLKFHQVVVNLLSNAIDACQKIELPHKEIRIHLKDGNNLIHFSIQDCGEGIAPEVLPKIFDSFFTTKSTGTGIGLSTTKEIVEKELGGKIFVQSEIGKGALFSIDFPWKKRGE